MTLTTSPGEGSKEAISHNPEAEAVAVKEASIAQRQEVSNDVDINALVANPESITSFQSAEQAKNFIEAYNKTASTSLFLDGLTGITPNVATELAEFTGDNLLLNGLTKISDEVATELAKFEGAQLYLNGLTEITPRCSKELAKFKGALLSLNGLTEITPDVATGFKEFNGEWLYLNGLTTLSQDVATGLVENFKGNSISLSGITTVDEALATTLATRPANVGLALEGATNITENVLNILTANNTGWLYLKYIEDLAVMAQMLESFEGDLSLHVKNITENDANILKGFKGSSIRLTSDTRINENVKTILTDALTEKNLDFIEPDKTPLEKMNADKDFINKMRDQGLLDPEESLTETDINNALKLLTEFDLGSDEFDLGQIENFARSKAILNYIIRNKDTLGITVSVKATTDTTRFKKIDREPEWHSQKVVALNLALSLIERNRLIPEDVKEKFNTEPYKTLIKGYIDSDDKNTFMRRNARHFFPAGEILDFALGVQRAHRFTETLVEDDKSKTQIVYEIELRTNSRQASFIRESQE